VRWLDWAFGLTALGWGLRPLLRILGGTVPAGPVPLTIAGVNLVAGVLFLARRAPTRTASFAESALSLASVLSAAVALKLAPPACDWPAAAGAVFAAAGAGAALSLGWLGASFGVLPAVRGLVERGPYRLVRHPAYACELAMVGACAGAALAAGAPLTALLVMALAVAAVVVRVRIEERLLAADEGYRCYAARVRWRLLPGVW
jgi:protein-S-isoprenylcysteine O-methyltransferase Ste14